MTGQDFQDKLDAIVTDLQTTGKGQTVSIALRGADNSFTELLLSSSAGGVVVENQLDQIQSFIDAFKPVADNYEARREPVMAALDAFNVRRATHQAAIDAASAARATLNTALEADATYQGLKTALDTARADVDYVAAVSAYQADNISENFGNLGDAKGKYIP